MTEYMVYFIKEGKKLKKRVVAYSPKEAQQRVVCEYGLVKIDGCKKVADEGLNYLKNMFGIK